ncbi:retrotransposon protein, putative, ty1-copia subclass [Tanacetum coccineum]
MKPLRFQDESNMVPYVFVVAEEEDTHEPLTYQEAVACEDSSNCKWLFKIKEGIEGVQKPRYKARLVARRFTQRADYELEQLDVKTTFLHENLEEMIYMRQPPGYEQGNKAEIGSTKSLLKKEFDMKELREAKNILDVEIVRDQSRKILRVSQSGYYDVERMNRGNHVDVTGFVDSDYTKDPDIEAEYMALTEAVKEAIWLRGLLKELGVELNTVAVNYDNQGTIHLLRNHVFHKRTKHIDVRYHFIREVLEENVTPRGILRRLEAFVASPIGCGGSDVGIA